MPGEQENLLKDRGKIEIELWEPIFLNYPTAELFTSLLCSGLLWRRRRKVKRKTAKMAAVPGSTSQVFESERENLMKHLLDAVKQVID